MHTDAWAASVCLFEREYPLSLYVSCTLHSLPLCLSISLPFFSTQLAPRSILFSNCWNGNRHTHPIRGNIMSNCNRLPSRKSFRQCFYVHLRKQSVHYSNLNFATLVFSPSLNKFPEQSCLPSAQKYTWMRKSEREEKFFSNLTRNIR